MQSTKLMFNAVLFWGLSAIVLSALQTTFAADVKQQICFVNTISGEGTAFLELNGVDLRPKGFGAGRATGWLDFSEEDIRVRAEHTPLGKAELNLNATHNSKSILILHRATFPSEKPGRPAIQSVALKKLSTASIKTSAKSKTNIAVLNLSEKTAIKMRLTSEAVEMKAGEMIVCPVGNAKFCDLTASVSTELSAKEGPKLEHLLALNVEETRLTLVIIFDSTDENGLGATTVRITP